MSRFILPKWVKRHNLEYEKLENIPASRIEEIKNKLEKFKHEAPEVSIVIPAFNEEKDIFNTLSSIADIETKYKTELVVANNSSTDQTQEILDRCGVKSVFAPI